jgi:hypothetical protein
MKKTLLAGMLFLGLGANAQLSNGSIAPNFTVNAYQPGLQTAGMNGNGTYSLYDYLDAGYTVILDVSATWCGPCWNYHLTNALDDLYAAHGPAGHPGVNANTTDDVMVIWIEGDGSTADATMLDGAGAIGNWINPTGNHEVQFPMANPPSALASQINNGFSIAYYPTVYRICPNRTVTLVGAVSAANLYAGVNNCPPPASVANDAALLGYTGLAKSCGAIDLKVRLQNNGTSPLTACTITATQGGTQVAQYNWSGNLATYAVQEVTIGQYTPTSASQTVNISVTSADGNAANNSVNAVVGLSPKGTNNNVTVKVTTDRYGSETTWKIFRSNGQVAGQGGPYADAGANGAYPQADVNLTLANDCYRLEVYDSYGDGFDSGYGDGKIEIVVNGTVLTGVLNFPSGDLAVDGFEIDAPLSTDVLELNNVSVYPNPASDLINVAFEAQSAEYSVALLDLQGRNVYSKSFTNASGAQMIAIPVADFAKGSYIVKVSSNGVSSVQNVVIK